MQYYKRNDVSNGMLPKGAPTSYTFNINFANGNPYVINLSDGQLTRELANIQTIYIDNSSNARISITMQVGQTDQKAIVPPEVIQILPLLIPTQTGSITLTSSTGLGSITVILLDIPIEAATLSAQAVSTGNFSFDAAGNANVDIESWNAGTLNVADTTLNPLVAASAAATTDSLNVALNGVTSGVISIPTTYPTITEIKSTAITSAIPANTSEIIMGAAPYNVMINSIVINIASNTTLATAGLETITFYIGATASFAVNVYIPATALNGSVQVINLNLPFNIGKSALNYEISTVLSTGNIDILVSSSLLL